MVVFYKNRFVKVFLMLLFLGLLVVIDFMWLSRVVNKGVNVSEGDLVIAKWLGYALAPLFILTEALYVYSNYLLAKAKGYSGWLTLLGFLTTPIGLVIIFLLPDRKKVH